MSPTARNRDCEDFQENVFPGMRTQKLEASELQALYGEDRDAYCCSPADGGDQMEEEQPVSDEYVDEGVTELTYVAGQSPDHIQPHRLTADTHLRRKVFFSNEAYYSKLEELKRAHLKNIADLQRFYLNQLASGQTDIRLDDQTDQTSREQMAPRHRHNVNPTQRHIGPDVSDTCVEECVFEQKDQPEWENNHGNPHVQQAHPTPPTDPPPQRKWCPFLKSSYSLIPAIQQPQRAVWAETQRRGSKVTIPQPFQMTLREEERKLRRVKTRSEVELENEQLRRELDELKECGRKFRATPAPASTHLPLYEVINMRLGPRQASKQQADRLLEKPSPRGHLQDKQSPKPRRNVPPLPQEPFSFIERERQKKEKKLQAELNNMTPREERRVFKARPVPKSLYRRTPQDFQLYGAISLHSRMQERRPNSTMPSGCLEESLQEVEEEEEEEMYKDEGNEGRELSPPLRAWGEKRRSAEKEMERRRIGEREKDWSYIHPLRRASVSRSQEVLSACKSEYISV